MVDRTALLAASCSAGTRHHASRDDGETDDREADVSESEVHPSTLRSCYDDPDAVEGASQRTHRSDDGQDGKTDRSSVPLGPNG